MSFRLLSWVDSVVSKDLWAQSFIPLNYLSLTDLIILYTLKKFFLFGINLIDIFELTIPSAFHWILSIFSSIYPTSINHVSTSRAVSQVLFLP